MSKKDTYINAFIGIGLSVLIAGTVFRTSEYFNGNPPRAENYLIQQGYDPESISVGGRGKSELCDVFKEMNRRNHRVQVISTEFSAVKDGQDEQGVVCHVYRTNLKGARLNNGMTREYIKTYPTPQA